jgi:hypothetical protein
MEELPKKFGDPGYFEFAQICREGFRKYLDHYVRKMHSYAPEFQIASNWAYTHFMPERVSIPVDVISGDYSMQNSVNAARLAARVMARQGKPWDLMAWSFLSRWQEGATSTKTLPQLCQEAAIVLAVGGGSSSCRSGASCNPPSGMSSSRTPGAAAACSSSVRTQRGRSRENWTSRSAAIRARSPSTWITIIP